MRIFTIGKFLVLAIPVEDSILVKYAAAMREAPGGYSAVRRGKKRNAQLTESEAEKLLERTGASGLDEIIEALEADMLEAAENLEFERAAALRDRIKSLREGVLPDM